MSPGEDIGFAFHRVATLRADFNVTKIAWSQDSRMIAAGGARSAKIVVFDVAAKKIISQIDTRSPHLHDGHFLFTADGKKLVAAELNYQDDGQEAVAVVWDVQRGSKLDIITCPRRADSSCIHTGAKHMVLSPDGKTLIVNYTAYTGGPGFGTYDAETWQFRRAFGPPSPSTSAFAMSPDGRHIAAGTKRGKVEIWNFHSGEMVRALSVNVGVVRGLAYTRAGEILLTAGEDSELRNQSQDPKNGMGQSRSRTASMESTIRDHDWNQVL